MAGTGLDSIQPISAGASAQPLATSAADVVTPDAVAQLTDSFRRGVITADDIANRVGQVGQANKKALLEQLGEYVSPDAINSRMAAINASGAQSSLAQNQATAAQGVVQPMTRAAIAAENLKYWDAVTGGGVTAFQTVGPWFGHKELPKTADGSPDWETMGIIGRGFIYPQRLMQLGQMGLEVDPAQTVKTEDTVAGKGFTKTYNKWGIENTKGSEGERYYSNLVRQMPGLQPGANLAPPAGMSQNPAIQPIETPPPSGMITAPRQAPSSRDFIAPAATSNASPATAQTLADAAQSIQPTQLASGVGTYAPGVGLQTSQGIGTAYTNPPAEAKLLSEQPEVKNWSEQKKVAGVFDTAAKAAVATSNKPAGDKIQINNDLGLIEAYAKLFDPQGVMREFKFNKASEAMTTLEKIKSVWPKYIAGTETFDDPSRQRLVNLGYDLIHSAEQSARDKIAGSKTRLEAAAENVRPGDADFRKSWVDQGITPDQQKILTGDSLLSSPYLSRPDSGAVPPGAAGPVKTLTGGLRVYLGKDGQFYKAP